MTLSEIIEAQSFWATEPFGDQRADWHAAQVAQACLAPWSKQQIPMNKLKLNFRTPAPEAQRSRLKDQLKAFAVMHNARINKKKA